LFGAHSHEAGPAAEQTVVQRFGEQQFVQISPQDALSVLRVYRATVTARRRGQTCGIVPQAAQFLGEQVISSAAVCQPLQPLDSIGPEDRLEGCRHRVGSAFHRDLLRWQACPSQAEAKSGRAAGRHAPDQPERAPHSQVAEIRSRPAGPNVKRGPACQFAPLSVDLQAEPHGHRLRPACHDGLQRFRQILFGGHAGQKAGHAAADLRQLLREVGIGGRVDAQDAHAPPISAPSLAFDHLENARLVRHLGIGNDHDLAAEATGRPRLEQRAFEGRSQVRATAVCRSQELLCPKAAVRPGRERMRIVQPAASVVEHAEVEMVAGGKAVHNTQCGGIGCLALDAIHGSRMVDQHDCLAGGRCIIADSSGWRDQRGKVGAPCGRIFPRQDAQRGAVAQSNRLPAEDAVAIRERLALCEAYARVSVLLGRPQYMGGAGYDAALPGDEVQSEAVAGIAERGERLGLHRVQAGLVPPRIARRRGERDPQGPPDSVDVGELDVGRIHHHILVRLQTGQAQCEDVGGFAGRQGRLPATTPGLLIVRLGATPLLQCGDDLHVPETHGHAAHCSVAREGEAVDRFQDAVTLGMAVPIGVSDSDLGQRAVPEAIDRRAAQRNKEQSSRQIRALHGLQHGHAGRRGIGVGGRVQHDGSPSWRAGARPRRLHTNSMMPSRSTWSSRSRDSHVSNRSRADPQRRGSRSTTDRGPCLSDDLGRDT